jgi:type IX secretion system PorP/SprF family membrane protein
MIERLKYSFTILLLVMSFLGFSQQDPLYTQYMNNPGLINPAYAGSKGATNISGSFRRQWVGMDWSPMTTALVVHSPFRSYEVGLGLTLIDDQIGPVHQTGLYADYARYFTFRKGHNLSLGLKAGFNYFDLNLLNLTRNEYDPHLEANERNRIFLPNFGVGLYYFTDHYYFGFSIPKIVRNDLKEKDNTLEVLAKEERHYYLTAGYLFTVREPILKMKLNTMARVVNGAPGSIELSATAILYDRVWFGLTYRFGDAIAAHARLQISERLQLGYSYDLNNSRLNKYNSGSHEIFISYDFSLKGQRILSPRYF